MVNSDLNTSMDPTNQHAAFTLADLLFPPYCAVLHPLYEGVMYFYNMDGQKQVVTTKQLLSKLESRAQEEIK